MRNTVYSVKLADIQPIETVVRPTVDRLLQDIADPMLDDFLNLRYLGIVLLLGLSGLGLPIPEEVVVVTAGFLSHNGEIFKWQYAYLACLGGALLGDVVVYSIGRYLGHGFFKRYPWFARLMHEEREVKMERVIREHGFKVFFVARFLVGVRVPLYLAAGVVRMSWPRFLLINTFCATTVVSITFWLGYRYGNSVVETIRESQNGLTIAILLAVAIGFVFYLLRRRRRTLLAAVEEDPSPEDSEKNSESDRIVA
ncbi:MAG: DedA family protein [Planctomycetota bacterium]|nr:DedA family protein [Planctomycetota bacterium]